MRTAPKFYAINKLTMKLLESTMERDPFIQSMLGRTHW